MKRQSRWAFDKFVIVKGPNECWPWSGSKTAFGHPVFGAEGRRWYAHRLVYERANGPIPAFPDRLVMHLCNNPSCCDPAHLELGTSADNMAYAGGLGTLSRKGINNGTSQLTEKQVEAIRTDPRSSRVIAPEYGVCHSHIRRIRGRKQWA